MRCWVAYVAFVVSWALLAFGYRATPMCLELFRRYRAVDQVQTAISTEAVVDRADQAESPLNRAGKKVIRVSGTPSDGVVENPLSLRTTSSNQYLESTTTRSDNVRDSTTRLTDPRTTIGAGPALGRSHGQAPATAPSFDIETTRVRQRRPPPLVKHLGHSVPPHERRAGPPNDAHDDRVPSRRGSLTSSRSEVPLVQPDRPQRQKPPPLRTNSTRRATSVVGATQRASVARSPGPQAASRTPRRRGERPGQSFHIDIQPEPETS